MDKKIFDPNIISDIKKIIDNARKQAYHYINISMVYAYWNIGRTIIKYEQKGSSRAEYGKSQLQSISNKLSKEYGKGFDVSNLRKMRQFYLSFNDEITKQDAVRLKSIEIEKEDAVSLELYRTIPKIRRELSWTHYRFLIRIKDIIARNWYMNEAADCNWSTRALERQINSLYYERLLSSQKKKQIRQEAKEKISKLKANYADFIKDPVVLEFLVMRDKSSYRESELEQALIDKLQEFLLELGKGFSFVARQKRITLNGDHFYIDLVFYNRFTKSFVLLDLKVGKLTHQDIGQMQMYLHYYQRTQKIEGENDPIGIILCTSKNDAVVEFTLSEDEKNIFASKYLLHLPTKQELKEEIIKEREIYEREKELNI